jgi:hypothetical protein
MRPWRGVQDADNAAVSLGDERVAPLAAEFDDPGSTFDRSSGLRAVPPNVRESAGIVCE